MKNYKSLVFLFFSIIFICGSCNEKTNDQQFIKTLAAGEWTMASQTLNGEEVDLGGTLTAHTINYQACMLADGDCEGSSSYSLRLDNGGTLNEGSAFTYNVQGGGTKMIFNLIHKIKKGKEVPCTTGCETAAEIVEWSDTKHVLKIVDKDDVYIRTMVRKDEKSTAQNYVQTLSNGAWTMTSQTINGEERDFGASLNEHVQIYQACKIANGDCAGTLAYSMGMDDGSVLNEGSSYSYSIDDDGKMITFNLIYRIKNGAKVPCTEGCEYEAEIVEISDTKHVLKVVDGDDVTIRTMERLKGTPTAQQFVETLASGTWTMTSQTLNDEDSDLGGSLVEHKQTFQSCSITDGDCSGSTTFTVELTDGGTHNEDLSFSYRVHAGGKRISFHQINRSKDGKTVPCTEGCETVAEVVEWADNRHVLKIVDGDDVYIRTMEKV